MSDISPAGKTSPVDRAARVRRERATERHLSSVTELLDQRTDLVGIHPMADLFYEAVRWSA